MEGQKYIIKVEPGNNATREYITDKRLPDGIECDGYMLVCFTGKNVSSVSIMNICVEDIANYLEREDGTSDEIMEAAMIAKGYRDAMQIAKRSMERSARKEGLKAFAEMILGGKDKE